MHIFFFLRSVNVTSIDLCKYIQWILSPDGRFPVVLHLLFKTRAHVFHDEKQT